MQLDHREKKLDREAKQMDARAQELDTHEAAFAEREKQFEEQLLAAEDPNSTTNVRIHAWLHTSQMYSLLI